MAGESPLQLMLRHYCRERGQNKVAEEIGLNKSTLCRALKGKTMDMQNTLRLINWLFGESHGNNHRH